MPSPDITFLDELYRFYYNVLVVICFGYSKDVTSTTPYRDVDWKIVRIYHVKRRGLNPSSFRIFLINLRFSYITSNILNMESQNTDCLHWESSGPLGSSVGVPEEFPWNSIFFSLSINQSPLFSKKSSWDNHWFYNHSPTFMMPWYYSNIRLL